MEFDYFYGRGTELFAFYQIPKILITDEKFAGITMDARMISRIPLEVSTVRITAPTPIPAAFAYCCPKNSQIDPMTNSVWISVFAAADTAEAVTRERFIRRSAS